MSESLFNLEFKDHKIKWRIRLALDNWTVLGEEYWKDIDGIDDIGIYSCTLEFYDYCNHCDTGGWVSVTGMGGIVDEEPIKVFIEECLASDIQESAMQAYNKCEGISKVIFCD